ncbi:hypothetical protein [Alloactinosynnema sp. L-07]|uniref:hypothetical protein n=1 Tax=Alloactinosynnema sp. L-07 TaxID=1653480 RepID=UPI00065F0258|nr:hypothetical protein [Alloactinosynnema sp. L-07]CRK59185.1 hypothetical protein [Alloactinosynnema sp. L-07]
MNADVIVTGAFTLVAALGGVWLTQRHVAREAERARAEVRRGELRKVVSELLLAGRSKVSTFQVLIPGFTKFSLADYAEFVETDSGKELKRVNGELTRTLAQASLLVGDPPILAAIRDVHRLDLGFASKAMGPIWDKSKDFDGVLEGLEYVASLGAALHSLELAAAPLLRAPVTPPEQLTRRTLRTLRALPRRLYRWWASLNSLMPTPCIEASSVDDSGMR